LVMRNGHTALYHFDFLHGELLLTWVVQLVLRTFSYECQDPNFNARLGWVLGKLTQYQGIFI